MDPKKTPMHKVVEDMGRAANRGRATRFTKKKPIVPAVLDDESHDTGPSMTGPRIEDAQPPGRFGNTADERMPPAGSHEMGDLTPEELDELMGQIQR